MEWLNELVRFHTGEPARLKGQAVAPWKVQVRGAPWAFATDGRMAVYLKGESAFGAPPEAFVSLTERYAGLAAEPTGVPIGLAKLRAFVGTPTFTREVSCKECNGTGTDTCDYCERSGECVGCDGTGKGRSSYEDSPVRVRGKLLDANMVAFLLAHLDGAAVAGWHVSTTNAGDVFAIGAPDWTALVVGMAQHMEEENEWPVFVE